MFCEKEQSLPATSVGGSLTQAGQRKKSSSLGPTPLEELERLVGLEQAVFSPGQDSGTYFAPMPSEDHAKNKIDILEMLQKCWRNGSVVKRTLTAPREVLSSIPRNHMVSQNHR